MSSLICDHEWAVKLTPAGRFEVCKRCGKTRTPADGWSCAGCGKGSSHSCECATKSLARPSSDGGRDYRWKDQQVALAPAPVAGGAVAKLAAEWRDRWDTAESDHKPALNFWMAAGELEAALAQDRAPVAGDADLREWIGCLVSMAAITDQESARHYAEKIEAALAQNRAKDQA